MTTTKNETASTAAASTVEEWLYAGERLDSKDKLYQVWVEPSGAERSFRKLTGGMPGHAYHIEVSRDGDKLAVVGNPRYLGERATRTATDAQLERWRAETLAAKQALEGMRAEKAAADDDDVQRALETLRRQRARLRSYAKRGAFDSYVLGELARPPREIKGGDGE